LVGAAVLDKSVELVVPEPLFSVAVLEPPLPANVAWVLVLS
jgi:hypothetical protein